MKQFITEYIKGCTTCQMVKVNTHPARPPLYPITPVENALPFETITMDFITKLLTSGGFDTILTITDKLNRMSAQPIIRRQTVLVNAPINCLNNIFDSSVAHSRTTGMNGFLLHSTRRTHGHQQPPRRCCSTYLLATPHVHIIRQGAQTYLAFKNG